MEPRSSVLLEVSDEGGFILWLVGGFASILLLALVPRKTVLQGWKWRRNQSASRLAGVSVFTPK